MELGIVNEVNNSNNSSKNGWLDSSCKKAHKNPLHFFVFMPGPL